MVTATHDNLALYHDYLVLSLPCLDNSGTLIRDIAKTHHNFGTNASWGNTGPGFPILDFDGATQYADCAAAATGNMDITTEDYSIAGWINYDNSVISQLLIGKYGIDLDGWELYVYSVNETMNLRHHHSSLTPDDRDGCYSEGWSVNNWHMFGISRDSLYPKMFRNGEEVKVTYDVGGLKNPDTCNRDVVIGTRYTKNTNWYKGYMSLIRVWVGKALSVDDFRFLFNCERKWFGV